MEPPVRLMATDEKFTCTECFKCFKLKSSLKRHRRDIHGHSPILISREIFLEDRHKEKLYECTACSNKFSRKYDLERHIRHTGCTDNLRPSFSCQECKRVFCRKDNLEEHRKISCQRFVKKKKKYKCERCNRQLQTVTLLKVHMRTHSAKRRQLNK